jgi:PAS domain S-box-containing protein
MTKKKLSSEKQANLRRQAEQILQGKNPQLSENLALLSSEEQQQLLHELQVHQVELEIQNESLRQTQDNLESSKLRYFNLYDLAPVGYFTLNEEGLILEANLTAGNLLGMTTSTLTNKPLTRFIFPEDQDIYYHHRKQLFDTNTPQVCELRLVKKDNSLFWVRLESTRAQDSENGNNLSYTVISDISERKLAEEKLDKNEKKFTTILNMSREFILLTDLKGRILTANESMAQHLGTNLETLLQGYIYDFLPPGVAQKRKLQFKQVIESGEPLYFEDGNLEKIFLNSLYPIFDSAEKIIGLALIGMDISERKQVDIIRSERMAMAGQLAAGVAHEFNNLLSIINNSAEYAKCITGDENELKKYLDLIIKSGNRGAQVVKKLLTFTKIIKLEKESVDLKDIIEEVIELINKDLENCSITVVRNYSDIPATLIDVGQIQQVFLNLIINAKNAMPEGGELNIKVEQEEQYLKIQFHNTGKTINKEDLDRLFAPFFVTSVQNKNGIPGTGLGLAVSYGIIKAHKGTIKAESKNGEGTTFTILLPVKRDKNMTKTLPKTATGLFNKDKRKLKSAKILIVEDEVETGQLFKKVLDEKGYSVTVAESGENAFNLCRKTKFDLIYLDIVFSGICGISLFKKIRKISPKTKIIFLTGKIIEIKVARMCIDEGAIGFLRKPIPLKNLVSYTEKTLKE